VVVAALRGAVGFLTRIPVGLDEGAWRAFQATPATFPVAGYLVGGIVAVPFAAAALSALPAPTVAVAYVVAVYAVTGINHLDGVADVGDAAVVHGDAERRCEVLKDTTVGVGATAAVAVTVLGLGLGALAVAGLPARAAVALVVAAEVGAKLGMAAVACLGSAAFGGMGAKLTERVGPGSLALPVALAAPATLLSWPSPVAAAGLVGSLAATGAVLRWANASLGGVNGDVFGAANEAGRLVALHVGVVVWTLF
jgi:adenosylcobinamide-GDP ribazoletransferase